MKINWGYWWEDAPWENADNKMVFCLSCGKKLPYNEDRNYMKYYGGYIEDVCDTCPIPYDVESYSDYIFGDSEPDINSNIIKAEELPVEDDVKMNVESYDDYIRVDPVLELDYYLS